MPGFFPPLGRRAWWLLAGYALEKMGEGLVGPFLIIYLTQVRDISPPAAGAIMSALYASGAMAVAVSGGLVDRVGAGRTVVLSLALGAAGAVLFSVAGTPWVALSASCLIGAGTFAMWNGFVSVLAAVVPRSLRTGAFAVTFLLQNLGYGLGALIGGMVVKTASSRAFGLAFLAEGAVFLAVATLLWARGEAPRLSGCREEDSPEENETVSALPRELRGYGQAASDRALVGVVVINALFACISMTLTEVAFPQWAVGRVGVSPRTVGLAVLVGSYVAVGSQLVVLRFLLNRWPRTQAVAASAVLSGMTYLLTLSAGYVSRGRAAASILVTSQGLFRLGQTMLMPTLYALVNDLAPCSLRGHYNAVFNLAWALGSVVGPALAGLLIGLGAFPALFLAGTGLCAGIAAAAPALRRVMRSEADTGHIAAAR